MKRVAIFEDSECPYGQLLQKVGSHKDNNGMLKFDLKRTVWCRKTDGTCLEENCPFPKLPERKQEKIYLDCNPDAYTYDTRAEGFNHCLDVITGDIKDE